MTPSITAATLPRAVPDRPPETDPLRAKAEELEAAFLSEMLGYSGLGEASDSFGGGIGEEQFASFLRQEQATAMVKHGGIGLAESLFRALSEANDAQG
ncbi:MAG: rod-binding protein [Paracoccaceae bacterium]